MALPSLCLSTFAHYPSVEAFYIYHCTQKLFITELIPKQFRFGKITPPKLPNIIPKESGQGFGNPVLTLLTEPK